MVQELDHKILEIAGRIKELRELENKTSLEMAQATELSEPEYLEYEAGRKDLNFAVAKVMWPATSPTSRFLP